MIHDVPRGGEVLFLKLELDPKTPDERGNILTAVGFQQAWALLPGAA